MNNIRIKPQIPEGEDGFILPSSYSSVSITISLFHSLTQLSLDTLITTAGFHASSNEVRTLQLFRWYAGTGVFKWTSSSILPTDSIITSPYKDAVFTSFYDTMKFLTSSITFPSPEIFSLASSEARFDTRVKKLGYEE